MRLGLLACASLTSTLVLGGCIGHHSPRRGDEIIVAGEFFHTGTRVVTYLEPQGYNAYRCYNHFDPTKTAPSKPVSKNNPNRYSNSRGNLPEDLKAAVDEQDWTLDNVREQVDLFVIHYDVCGTSQQCFYILHDYRGLSVHFMLDLDGTIYQTLDLAERAWHAGSANDRSVGVEIAHWGAHGTPEKASEWYALDESGCPYVNLPAWLTRREQRTPDFVARPARPEMIEGCINGSTRYQYDFTREQYEALGKLTAALHRALPRIKLAVPRGPDGKVIDHALSADELADFSGLLGHWHITRQKQDPGPAFDWDRVLNDARWAL